TGSSTSYPSGDLSLSVVKGTDQVQGVVLGYPGAHAINAPTVNSTVSAGQPLHVSWTTPSVAQSVTITTRDFNATDVSDTGSYDIAGTNNPARTNQRVIIVRSNQLDLAGGLSGSLAKVTVTRRVDPFIVNCSGLQLLTDPQRDERRAGDVDPLLQHGTAGIERAVSATKPGLDRRRRRRPSEPLLDAQERIGAARELTPPGVLAVRQDVGARSGSRVGEPQPAS